MKNLGGHTGRRFGIRIATCLTVIGLMLFTASAATAQFGGPAPCEQYAGCGGGHGGPGSGGGPGGSGPGVAGTPGGFLSSSGSDGHSGGLGGLIGGHDTAANVGTHDSSSLPLAGYPLTSVIELWIAVIAAALIFRVGIAAHRRWL
jgi:hypothetical protein